MIKKNTGQERQVVRREIARNSGYEHKPLPPDPEWAGINLPAPVDDKAHAAALAARGIKR